MVEKSAAVIVTFRPDEKVICRINTLAEQVEVLYVIDNTPELVDFSFSARNIVFERNFNKGGLAGAINIAMAKARTADKRYFFVFDQDTEVESDFCGRLKNAALLLNRNDWAIIGPRHVNTSTGHPVRLSVPNRFMNSLWPDEATNITECLFIINSCSLLDLQKIPLSLLYDEDLAVDMIDVDFCLAVRAANSKVLCIPSITVVHGIGNRKEGSFAFSATNYNSSRKYLQTRNRFIVWKKYFAYEKAYVVTDALIWIMDSARTVTFEVGRVEKAKAILRGIRHGVNWRKKVACQPVQ